MNSKENIFFSHIELIHRLTGLQKTPKFIYRIQISFSIRLLALKFPCSPSKSDNNNGTHNSQILFLSRT